MRCHILMGISRRDFLKGTAAFSMAGAVPFDNDIRKALTENDELSMFRNPLSIVQGPTNETTTQVAVDIPKFIPARYQLIDTVTGQEMEAETLRSSSRAFSLWRADQTRFHGLQLGRDYELRVYNKTFNTLVDRRTLRALDTHKANARVAFMSCMVEISPQRFKMWNAVEKCKPDVIFLQGDNVYGDLISRIHGPAVLWWRYIFARRLIPFYHWHRLVPAIAIWDDHDFGFNDVTGDYEHRDHSYDTFCSFYAQKELPGFFERGPGISAKTHMFGTDFIFLDGRLFRLRQEYEPESYLGPAQFTWVEKHVLSSNAPVWLALGSQFFSTDELGHSYELMGRREFDQFKRMLAAGNRPVLLSSGDRHFSEVMRIERREFGFDAVEMTSSSIHSIPDKDLPENNRRVEGVLKENFMFMDLGGENPEFKLTCVGRDDRIQFERLVSF